VTGPKTNERLGTRASLRGAQMSAYKVREVLDLIRGHEVAYAADILRFCERGAADAVAKILASAVANAAHNDELDPEELYVSACYADEGRTMRRMRPRARGRASRIRKRSSHITVIVSRLPEDRLARLRARRAAEQASRRARRGGRGAGALPDRARRVGRGRGATATAADTMTAGTTTAGTTTGGGGTAGGVVPATEAIAHDPVPEGMADAELRAGIVDPQAAAVEHNEHGSDEAGAGSLSEAEGEEFHGAFEDASSAGIVDTDAAAVEGAEQHEIHSGDRPEGAEQHDVHSSDDAEGNQQGSAT